VENVDPATVVWEILKAGGKVPVKLLEAAIEAASNN
jgi:hypothetical protein